MAVKIVMMFNRADSAGWSETYYSNASGTTAAIAGFSPVMSARQSLLAAYCYLYATRYTLVTTPLPARRSQLILQTNPAITSTGGGGAGAFNADVGTVGALTSLTNQLQQSEPRLIRGMPDSWMLWDIPTQRMSVLPIALGPLYGFIQTLTSGTSNLGWIPRGTAGGTGTQTSPITAVAQTAGGPLVVTYTGGASFNPLTNGTIILGGFKGKAASLNGQYGYHQWASPATGTINISKTFPSAAPGAYLGTGGTVRIATNTFVAYTAVSSSVFALVRTRNIGSPFGRTRGRRPKAA